MRLLLTAVVFIGLFGQGAGGETLAHFLADRVIRDYQLDPERVHITLSRSDVDIADLTGIEVKTYPQTQARPRGRFPMRVELYREGTMIDRGMAVLDVRLFADLPVPRQNIKRHELLSPDLFEVTRFDVTSLTEKMLEDVSQVAGCRARHNLTAGRYVPLRRVEKLPDVENGLPVTIIAGARGLEIRARGIALQNGMVGETIKVKNIDSRKILMGTVAAPGVVEIAI